MLIASTLATAALLFLVAAPATAQDKITTVSGRAYEGRVISDDGSTVEFETTDGAKMKLPYEQLTPRTQYTLRLKQTEDTGKGHLALAEWCVQKTFYDEARAEYRKALAMDATLTEAINASVIKARTTAANEVLGRAKGLQKEGKLQEARQLLSKLVQELPLEAASKEAMQLLSDESTTRKQDVLKRPAKAAKDSAPNAPPRADGASFSEATKKTFAPVIEDYHQLLDSLQDGLRQGGSKGIEEFEKAIKQGGRLAKTLDKLRPQGAADAEVAEALQIADGKLEEAVVDARSYAADAFILRTSYNQAMEVVDQGLAEYPKNERLRSTRERVAMASDNDFGGGWGILGRR